MATIKPEKVEVILKLNNGITPSGTVKTVNLAIGGTSQKINSTAYLADDTGPTKAFAIGTAIARIIDKTVYETVEVRTSQITNS